MRTTNKGSESEVESIRRNCLDRQVGISEAGWEGDERCKDGGHWVLSPMHPLLNRSFNLNAS